MYTSQTTPCRLPVHPRSPEARVALTTRPVAAQAILRRQSHARALRDQPRLRVFEGVESARRVVCGTFQLQTVSLNGDKGHEAD